MDKTINSKKSLIVGSIGFDIIFSIHGKIQDELAVENGKISKVNMMFTAKNKKLHFGGTAGNIAYGLGLLKSKPMIFSVAGRDFNGEYLAHLKKAAVDSKIFVDDEGFCATFYAMSDDDQQQIGIWQPNSYSKIDTTPLASTLSEEDLKSIDVAIFSAGTGASIFNHMNEFRKINSNAKVIFDPGQVLSIFYNPELFAKTARMANIFIANEVEIRQLKTILGFEIADLFDFGIEYIIETKGKDGSIVHSKDRKEKVEPVEAKRVVETTGAGDAYRSGLIYGLLNGKSIIDSCKIGAILGAKSVEHEGPQGYVIDETFDN